MCQVWMRHVVCKAHEGYLENVALVYLQQICTLQNGVFPHEIQQMFSFENISSKCISKPSRIGKALYSQT